MLSPKRQRFVEEYLKDFNGKQAAIRSGYAAASAEVQASRLLRTAQVRAAVEEARAKLAQGAELSAARVLEEYRRLAFADLRGLFDEQGNLKAIRELSAEQAATVASVEVIKRNVTAGDGAVDTLHKLRTWDKVKALDSLAKYFGLDVQRVEHSGGIDVRWMTDADAETP